MVDIICMSWYNTNSKSLHLLIQERDNEYMITKQEFETLFSQGMRGSFFVQDGEIDIRELTKQSRELCGKWENYYCDNEREVNFKLTDDMKFVYKTTDGIVREADITEFAFSQLCTRLGVPASYVKKCFDVGKVSLAVSNFRAWADDCDKQFLIREQDGVIRAVLSDSYKMFDTHRVLRTLQNTVDSGEYRANGAFLSADRLHVRFVNREPMNVPNENSPIYSGFTVSSSDVGRGSLAMHYFLYRQVCDNGMTVTDKGGTLFRQAHIGSAMNDGKLELFNRAFMDIEMLNNYSFENIRKNQDMHLKDYEMQMYIEKAKRELKLSEKAQEKLLYIIDNSYDHSRWGILNGITEIAQDYTLDTRIEFETFAGNTMFQVA